MEGQIYLDSSLFLRAIAFGLIIGLFYEVFRFLRIAFYHPSFLVAVEDLLFFLPVTGAFILFQYVFSDGVVRWFSIAGGILGFLLYLNTVGRILKRFSTLIIGWIRRALFLLYRLTLHPLIKVFKKITVCLFTRVRSFAIMVQNKRRIRSLARAKLRFLKRAAKGFSK